MVSRFVREKAVEDNLSTTGRTLLGEEDFNGPSGAPPDSDFFDYDVGDGNRGDGEKQIYTDDPANARLSPQSSLIIEVTTLGMAPHPPKW